MKFKAKPRKPKEYYSSELLVFPKRFKDNWYWLEYAIYHHTKSDFPSSSADSRYKTLVAVVPTKYDAREWTSGRVANRDKMSKAGFEGNCRKLLGHTAFNNSVRHIEAVIPEDREYFMDLIKHGFTAKTARKILLIVRDHSSESKVAVDSVYQAVVKAIRINN